MLGLNKNIKLGKYEILFNLIRNQYMFKKHNNIQYRSKTKGRILQTLENLHESNEIDIMELHQFMGFVDDIEAIRNKPLVGRHSNQFKENFGEYIDEKE